MKRPDPRPLGRAVVRRMPRFVRRRLRDAYLDRRIRRSGVFAHPDPPVTFSEKVRYKIVNDHRPLLTQWADKVAVRDYVARTIGAELLTELYLVTDDPDQVREEALPREFALKASHGSHGCLIAGDHVDPARTLLDLPVGWRQLDVSPSSLDWPHLRSICREWLSLRFREGIEWAYRDVPPRILVEELLVADGAVPADFRLFVFHGSVRLIRVDLGRFSDQVGHFYSPDWEALTVEEINAPAGPPIERPASLPEMVRIAETFGRATDLVRVDLYDVDGRIVFGELTNYPWGGEQVFVPESFDRELGAFWTVPRRYR